MKTDVSDWIKEAEKKQKILDLLLPTLQEIKDLQELKYLEYKLGKESVAAGFQGGTETSINIAGDSDIAMVYDVVVKLWRPS